MRENRGGLPELQPHVVAVGSLQVVGEWQKDGGGLEEWLNWSAKKNWGTLDPQYQETETQGDGGRLGGGAGTKIKFPN